MKPTDLQAESGQPRECAAWREEIVDWELELQDAREELEKVEQAIQEHARALEAHKREFAGASADLEAGMQEKLREEHARLKKHQHVIVTLWLELMKSSSNW